MNPANLSLEAVLVALEDRDANAQTEQERHAYEELRTIAMHDGIDEPRLLAIALNFILPSRPPASLVRVRVQAPPWIPKDPAQPDPPG